MNKTIETILNHRSIRKYKNTPLSDDQIDTLVQSAQAASTSSFIQAYSIIGVKDPAKKKKLAELAGNQPYVAENGHLFVFCADLHRHEILGTMEEVKLEDSLESTETFMVSLIDVALAAQNLVIAAESMGLGTCYIGGIRNNLEGVEEVLDIPKRVIPLFGLTVGYPAHESSQKPRLPKAHIYHEERYEQDEEKYLKELEAYNEVTSSYYKERTGGKREDTWTAQMANMLHTPKRTYMKEYIEKKGFSNK